MAAAMKKIFVTVGTTSFDKLIQAVSSPEIQQICQNLGYTEMVMQIGRGTYEPQLTRQEGFHVEFYRYKNSLAEDIQQASLVISHAGAGSCLETLGAGKPLLVVINEDLMNNHQLELAYQLSKDGHLFYSNCSSLGETLQAMDTTKLKPFTPGEPKKFASFLDSIMGVS